MVAIVEAVIEAQKRLSFFQTKLSLFLISLRKCMSGYSLEAYR